MKKDEIQVGGHYAVMTGQEPSVVRVDRILNQTTAYVGLTMTTYEVTDVLTGRELRLLSARRFRKAVDPTKAEARLAADVPGWTNPNAPAGWDHGGD